MVGRVIKLMVRLALFSIAVVAVIVWLLFFSERPENQIDPFTLAGDGSALNYCELPPLDGSGKLAVDIPKGNTPGCSYEHFPLPILRECTEPLRLTQTTLEACGLVSRAATQGTLSALSNVVSEWS